MMKVKQKIEEPVPVSEGVGKALWDFVKLLEDMENKGEMMRSISGNFSGSFGSKASYNYSVKLGIEARDFPLRRGFHPRSRPVTHVRSIKPEPITTEVIGQQEPVIDVFEKGEEISVIAQLPYVREEDIDLKIVDNILKITTNSHKGKKNKDIPVSGGNKIKEASFKNGILEITLSKKDK